MAQRALAVTTVLILLTAPLFLAFLDAPFIKYQEPEFLTFEELKTLSKNPHPDGALEKKLERFWRTPVISNEAYYRGAKPIRPIHPLLGPSLRLVSWNIEKSFRMDDAVTAFTSARDFERLINPGEVAPGSASHRKVMRQREKLTTADVIVLQEMDIGVKRSGYVDAARKLAEALNMNYAYGTEYLEIDPVYLGLEKIQLESGEEDKEAEEYYAVDPARYKGAFGCAVLSRYPIKHVEVFQLKNQAYDWYAGEKEKTTFLEGLRRFGTKTAFKNELTREMKVGGRIYFRVDLEVPELPGKTLTIINIHLEIKCLPKGREKQMAEIFSYLKGIKNPVIVVGDFNSAPTDLSPTSVTRTVKRTAKNPTTWLTLGLNAVSPHALALNTTRGVSNVTKNFNDPLAKHIPVVAPNPVKPMFERIRDFKFEDGGAFDFRGNSDRSVNGKSDTLSNSNQRGRKGFKTTFSVKRPWGVIGKYRLDWVFVKSFLKSPEALDGSYRFAPHFGETLEEMNTSLEIPISDHHPNAVDLPLEEPKI